MAAVASAQCGYGADRQWLAKLSLTLVPTLSDNKTHLKGLSFLGPLRIQRPFYPEGGVCHLYILHPPGGLVSGDKLLIDADCKANSRTLLTTPSAGKIYGRDSDGVAQVQSVALKLAAHANCEWLPQETIIFDNANAKLDTKIYIDSSARFIGWDLVCLGRAASNADFNRGQLQQRLQLFKDDRLMVNEQLQLSASSELYRSRVGFNNSPVFGTLMATAPDLDQVSQTLIEALREALDAKSFSITMRLNVLLVRYLGSDMNACRSGMWQAWSMIRPMVLGRPACIPRIWLT
ncbi:MULTISPECIES: urease accessory protein UreD [Psychrobacter]|uniref:urease accessory protein UreD n=1 Tax=Psychrobacter TaxID=497 RepID=UPI00146F899A|nr:MULTISPECIES: urease accessory protein UreD [Psychrobacter]